MARHQEVTLHSGLKMRVDLESTVQSTIFWYDGDMEPQLSWAIRELLPVGGTMVDCGANCGYAGLEARLRKHASVLLIEPHPDLADSIQANIKLNEWSDSCELIRAAASDHPGTSPLFVCRTYDGSHSLFADWWPHPEETAPIDVELITLESILKERPSFQRVSFLKVDTEGSDFAVLKGLGPRLDPEQIPVIYAEMTVERQLACQFVEKHGYAGFGYRPHPSGKALRRDLRRYGNGERPPFFFPLDRCPGAKETLWVAKGSEHERYLLELAEPGIPG